MLNFTDQEHLNQEGFRLSDQIYCQNLMINEISRFFGQY